MNAASKWAGRHHLAEPFGGDLVHDDSGAGVMPGLGVQVHGDPLARRRYC